LSEILAFYIAHEVPLLIFVLGLVTYLTRIGGYLVLSRFENIPTPVQAALEAVPAAVITTIVVPPALSAGLAEITAMVVAGLACFRLQPILVIVLGLAVLVALRQMGL
jgi:uncharacterized membrane protein